MDLQSNPSEIADSAGSVSTAATRLSAPFSVASAYSQLGSSVPDASQISGVQYSLLLQEIYVAQHADGSWGNTLDGAGAGSTSMTAQVLLALHRSQAYDSPGSTLPPPDQAAINRGLAYLSGELARPVRAIQGSSTLDERAYALYVLSLYNVVPIETVRSMLAYAASGLGDRGLSLDGQAWLALALWQEGNSADAVALLDHLLATTPGTTISASSPMLEALVVAQQSLPANAYRSSDSPDYKGTARLYLRALMEARQGAGWQTASMTADALWALSRYAAAEGESPQSGDTAPVLTLGDRPVQAVTLPGNPGVVSVVLSGAELRPGTNWLTLKPSDSGQTLYYSLTLIAEK
jgi:hypothetical protein